MKKSDFAKVLVIGLLIGVLVQPILANVVHTNLTIGLRTAVVLGLGVFALFALFVAYLVNRVFAGIYQFAQFAAVGTLNTLVDIGVFNLEVLASGAVVLGSVTFALFKAISFLTATTNSFFWNKYWTFHSTDEAKTGQVASFYAVAVGGLLLNTAAGTLINALRPMGLHETMERVWTSLIAPGGGVIASFLWNFLWYKYVVFKKPSAAAASV